jgi:hypothetical protein
MAHKAHRVLKAKATVAEKVAAVMAAAVKSSAAIRVLTTVVKARAVVLAMVHVLKAVQTVVAKAVVRTRTVAVKVVKSAAVAMATSCHATSIL